RGAPTERAEPLEPIDAVDDGGWNGPMPNFLLAKLTLTD
ncbi:MAG: hypothetical protein ACJASD_003801, partial [Sphingomonas echinoides]